MSINITTAFVANSVFISKTGMKTSLLILLYVILETANYIMFNIGQLGSVVTTLTIMGTIIDDATDAMDDKHL